MKYKMATSLFIQFLNYKFHKDLFSYMHTGRVTATGVLHGCDHTYIAYVAGTIICIYPLHTVAEIGPLWTPWWGEVPCIRERLLTTQLLNLSWVPLDWIPFL
jgi:hypothetical protein